VTCSKSGWCLCDQHDTCPREWWSWDHRSECTCECHKDAA